MKHNMRVGFENEKKERKGARDREGAKEERRVGKLRKQQRAHATNYTTTTTTTSIYNLLFWWCGVEIN
jgi:hypothetical protein